MSDVAAAPTPRVVLVDGVPMSGLLACPAEADPLAVVVAIHGGATTGAYFDCPGHPHLSLLRLGARLGFTVIALDRPGFGSSALYAEEFTDPARRTEMTFGAIDAILGDRGRGAGIFVLAHSNGTELALQMAAHPDRGEQLLGVEISGTGLRQQESAAAVLSTASIDNVPTGLRQLLWEPAELYPDGIVGAVRIKAGPISPGYEGGLVTNWAATITELAARVRVPVRYALAEFERVWSVDDADVREVAELFTAAPHVRTAQRINGGHNLSLGHTAAAYHLSALSFAEECRVRRLSGVPATTDFTMEAN
ncbi:thioesterase [Mycolicibacterium chitae]|uniref:Lysophospholipase n=1 Tax=Mycolicibacterium chitae TaxID=1792 RepID=A0A3S4RLG7_MYCCI|nr:alpha/beta hydrolase family protein [Mycolicibacterium chitae]MCV7107531.1 alpha/beta fold hydrolase [Mycolicibacterium chitae]BBZ03460.1 thioesterase [Mycolicibacterium chitae]VEG47025.1 lysophospholipase [Mycolicibacterium chitae]